jgi:hypothetical protein
VHPPKLMPFLQKQHAICSLRILPTFSLFGMPVASNQPARSGILSLTKGKIPD